MRKLGDTQTQEIGPVRLTVAHVGAPVVRRWAQRTQRFLLDEAKRVRAMVADLGEDLIAQHFAEDLAMARALRSKFEAECSERALDPKTPEPERAYLRRLLAELPEVTLARVVSSLERGEEEIATHRANLVETVKALDYGTRASEITDPEQIVNELDRLGLIPAAMIFAREVQAPSAAQFPADKGNGGDGADVKPGSGASGVGG